MAYFKIGTTDCSSYVSALKVGYVPKYKTNTNANGDTVVDLINTKRTFDVTIRHLNDTEMAALMNAVAAFNVSVSCRDTKTNALAENVDCIVSAQQPEYYTIQNNLVIYKPLQLTFSEL